LYVLLLEQGIVGIVGGHDLVNKDPIWICCANTPSFPPKNFGLCPRDPIVLVKEDNPNEAVAIVQKVETVRSVIIGSPFLT